MTGRRGPARTPPPPSYLTSPSLRTSRQALPVCRPPPVIGGSRRQGGGVREWQGGGNRRHLCWSRKRPVGGAIPRLKRPLIGRHHVAASTTTHTHRAFPPPFALVSLFLTTSTCPLPIHPSTQPPNSFPHNNDPLPPSHPPPAIPPPTPSHSHDRGRNLKT
ncbi:hypothetical protein E2C01_079959 [Portunus trituberculatus]|uniref:Uncharacterized protein n=1 Tax=Portunus trituberculatus TaxID=210409 RepID=A0A5B7IU58_PORTR|nr:hypothetical protein [Portunus trituberculatus]